MILGLSSFVLGRGAERRPPDQQPERQAAQCQRGRDEVEPARECIERWRRQRGWIDRAWAGFDQPVLAVEQLRLAESGVQLLAELQPYRRRRSVEQRAS